VTAAPSTNINVTDLTLGGEVVLNNYIYESDHTSDQIITIEPDFTTGQPTLRTMASVVFPDHLDQTFSDDSSDHSFNSTNPSDGIGNLIIAISDIENNNAPESFNITTTVSSLIDSDSDSFTEVITIIPAQPPSMNGNDFATKELIGHPAGMEDEFYTGDLPSNIGTYKGGHNQTSTTTPTTVDNIYKTGLGEGDNIILHTHTNGTANYTGTYGDSNLAYNFGDQGVINLIINGVTKATYNLGTSFDPNLKTGNQGVKTVNFTEGSLVINNIQPFNQVHQNITDKDGVLYPNGYQAWDATVNIDTPLRSGYNTVKLQHTFGDGKPTQETTLLDWYYDDGNTDPSANSGFTLSISEITNPSSFYLSGVQFYLEDAILKVSLNNAALNIPHETMLSDIIGETSINGGNISSGSSNPSSATSLKHRLSNVSNKNGLIFDGKNMNVLTPDKTDDTAHIQNLKIKSTGISNSTVVGDTSKTIDFQVKNRNLDEPNSDSYQTAVTKTIGRFAEALTPTDTRLMEDFSSEIYRWADSTEFDDSSVDFTGTTNPNYDSEINIDSTADLQQTILKTLIYPSNNFNSVISLPNSRDYSSAQAVGNRYYYRAFEFKSSDFGAGASLSNISFGFNLEITSTFTESELINVDGGIESKDIKIDVRIPNGGTEWGVISSEIPKNSVVYNDVGSEGWLARNMSQNIIVNNDTIKIPITLHSIKLNKASGIILVRIRLKTSSTDKEISKVEFTILN
tara:strand:- start:6181 stop:8400 length:2220 start_codon:yes stop_codon:yes gene_type:complete